VPRSTLFTLREQSVRNTGDPVQIQTKHAHWPDDLNMRNMYGKFQFGLPTSMQSHVSELLAPAVIVAVVPATLHFAEIAAGGGVDA
jgi:hypothetical protein